MGRYTSQQTYSDLNTKVVSGYNTTNSSNSGKESKTTDRVVVEKVNNVSGSCAGAGSGEFDVYRAARRRELDRLSELDRLDKEMREKKAFEDKVASNKAEAEARRLKNSLKRKKKIEKRKMTKTQHEIGENLKDVQVTDTNGNSCGEEEDPDDDNSALPCSKVPKHNPEETI